jgi:hypothetical protein
VKIGCGYQDVTLAGGKGDDRLAVREKDFGQLYNDLVTVGNGVVGIVWKRSRDVFQPSPYFVPQFKSLRLVEAIKGP